MADLGWGGVPRMNPSDTALKYLNGFHKILVSAKMKMNFREWKG